jgi:sterol 3beta-glucosyltransferase
MRVLMLSPGTRGDVAPATGLAAGFRRDGHDVAIVAGAAYRALVEGAGCAFQPVTADMHPTVDPNDPQSSGGVREYLRALRKYMDSAATAALAAAPGADVILTNAISPYGHDIAESMNIPSIDMLLQPAHPSADYPPMIFSARDHGRFGNRLAGRLAQAVPTPIDPACARVRRELGLPAEGRRAAQKRRWQEGRPVHHGISPVVLPRPGDWPPELLLDGYWWPHEPAGWAPSDDLASFLDAGPAPLVVSLGSVPSGTAATAAVVDALRETGVRAVLQGGEFEPLVADLDLPGVLHVGDVPHSWLLPRSAAVVHHAGAGITAACLRAGVPSIPMPVHTDQPFWASRLARLGAGTAPVPAAKATGAQVTAAIKEATERPDLRKGAQRIADALAAEDGTALLRARLRSLAG